MMKLGHGIRRSVVSFEGQNPGPQENSSERRFLANSSFLLKRFYGEKKDAFAWDFFFVWVLGVNA